MVPDIEDEIIAALNALRGRYDYVITTGGIGPTHDDITADCVAEAFGVALYEHPEIIAMMQSRWQGELNAARRRMARVPEGGSLVKNAVQGPPGFQIGNVFVLAGVPMVMRGMMEDVGAAAAHRRGGDRPHRAGRGRRRRRDRRAAGQPRQGPPGALDRQLSVLRPAGLRLEPGGARPRRRDRRADGGGPDRGAGRRGHRRRPAGGGVMAEGDSVDPPRVWFVQAAGRVWGPYPDARIEDFVGEGRVAADTLMATSAEGPFHPAARQARLHRLFGDAAPAPGAPAPVEAVPDRAGAHALGPARALMVWAGLKSQRPERFEQAVAAHGPFVRVGADLWLVRTRLSPPGLRNALTRRLDAADALMVVEAPLDQAAWFNLDGDADRTLRQLWADGEH